MQLLYWTWHIACNIWGLCCLSKVSFLNSFHSQVAAEQRRLSFLISVIWGSSQDNRCRAPGPWINAFVNNFQPPLQKCHRCNTFWYCCKGICIQFFKLKNLLVVIIKPEILMNGFLLTSPCQGMADSITRVQGSHHAKEKKKIPDLLSLLHYICNWGCSILWQYTQICVFDLPLLPLCCWLL